jgi:hypothetical protein
LCTFGAVAWSRRRKSERSGADQPDLAKVNGGQAEASRVWNFFVFSRSRCLLAALFLCFVLLQVNNMFADLKVSLLGIIF